MAQALATASGKLSSFAARQPRIVIGSSGLGGILLLELIALLAGQVA